MIRTPTFLNRKTASRREAEKTFGKTPVQKRASRPFGAANKSKISSVSKQSVSRRRAAAPRRRIVSIVLVAGILLALAAAVGPVWFARAGVGIMIVAAVVAVRFAWQQLRDERRENGLKSLDQLHAHGTQLSAERARNREVLDVLRKQGEQNDQKVVELQLTIGQLRTELASLRGDHAALQAEAGAHRHRIERLTADLTNREAELLELKGLEDHAEIVEIPRQADWDALPSAEDLWADGNHPTVVDLQRLVFPGEDQLRKQA